MGKLFATTVTSAKPREREYKLSDGAGLYLLVKQNGRKLWRLNYAYLGKQRTLSFGLAGGQSRRAESKPNKRGGAGASGRVATRTHVVSGNH